MATPVEPTTTPSATPSTEPTSTPTSTTSPTPTPLPAEPSPEPSPTVEPVTSSEPGSVVVLGDDQFAYLAFGLGLLVMLSAAQLLGSWAR